jgi:ribosome-associated protein
MEPAEWTSEAGVRAGPIVVPEAELVERFSHSSGPGGQSVNTSDTRVELRWDVANSAALTDAQRARLLDRLAGRLVGGILIVTASEFRSQWRNRQAARARMSALLAEGLRPPPAARRATRPSRAARERRLTGKKHRGEVKRGRGRVDPRDG